jgi:hypothetical protein
MTNLILVSKVNIINRIFTLVAKNLSINLTIVDDNSLLEKVDVIIIDDDYIDDNIIKYKSYCNKLILLSQQLDTKDDNFDMVFTKPFLPSQLQQFLKTIDTTTIEKQKPIEESSEDMNELISFVEDMTDEPSQDNVDEYDNNDDDTLIRKEELGHGGVLDKDELSKLFTLVNDEDDDTTIQNDTMKDDDWKNLSQIIDEAIDDVEHHTFKDNIPIKLVLNEYSMKELSPLFHKLNQNIIDNLTKGQEIILQLKLEK